MSAQQQQVTTQRTQATAARTAPPLDGQNNPIKTPRHGAPAPDGDGPRTGRCPAAVADQNSPGTGGDSTNNNNNNNENDNNDNHDNRDNRDNSDGSDVLPLSRNPSTDGSSGEDGERDRTGKVNVNARRRWKLLAKALRHDSSEDEQFSKFNLIECDRAYDEKDENVYVYRLCDRYRLKIRLIGERPWTANELIGFNNTGNICVWPSEEALAHYVLSRLHLFESTRILELGGGMTCLAGLVLAKYGQPGFVHVTDGNELSVENVRKSLNLNKFNCTIKTSVLKWEQTTGEVPVGDRYHFILSADCLFFDESRSQLIDTIWVSLADEGIALITAPRRGHTLAQFLNECVARGFHYELLQCYNEAIWAKHLELKRTDGYDENLHYPLLIKMYKHDHIVHRP